MPRKTPYRAVLARSCRGVSLIEALVALLILSFGMLGMVGVQARLLKEGTEAQPRVVAANHEDGLVSLALVDPANADCYTEPLAGVCSSTAAQSVMAQWRQDLQDAMPSAEAQAALVTGASSPGGAPVGSNQQLRVRIEWQDHESGEPRLLEVMGDVR